MSDSATVRSVQTPVSTYMGRFKGAMSPLKKLLAFAPAKNELLSTKPQSIVKPHVRATRPEILKSESIQSPELTRLLPRVNEEQRADRREEREPSIMNPNEDNSSEVRMRRKKTSLVKMSRVQKLSKTSGIISMIRRIGRKLSKAEMPRHHSISLSRSSLIRRRKRRDIWISLAIVIATSLYLLAQQ